MSFLKCSILATENLHASTFINTKIKGQTMIFCKKNFGNGAFKVGVVLPKIDKFQLKIKLTKI